MWQNIRVDWSHVERNVDGHEWCPSFHSTDLLINWLFQYVVLPSSLLTLPSCFLFPSCPSSVLSPAGLLSSAVSPALQNSRPGPGPAWRQHPGHRLWYQTSSWISILKITMDSKLQSVTTSSAEGCSVFQLGVFQFGCHNFYYRFHKRSFSFSCLTQTQL